MPEPWPNGIETSTLTDARAKARVIYGTEYKFKSKDEVPAEHVSLYTEHDGDWVAEPFYTNLFALTFGSPEVTTNGISRALAQSIVSQSAAVIARPARSGPAASAATIESHDCAEGRARFVPQNTDGHEPHERRAFLRSV